MTAAVDEAVSRLVRIDRLRRDRDTIMASYRAGTASEDDLRRYRTIRLALAFHDSPARRPHLPRSVDDVLRRRSELVVELMLGADTADPPVAS